MIDKEYAGTLIRNIDQDLCNTLVGGYPNRVHIRLISRFEDERLNLIGEGLSKMWDRLMSSCKGYEQGRALLVSEKALACLIRKGVDKKDIRMNGTNARVQLNNFTYYVDKEGAGCSAGPCGYKGSWSRIPTRWIALSGEDFADFMFEFDDLVADIVTEIDKIILEYRIKAAQYDILCQSVNHLGELFLKQGGISWNVETDFTDTDTPVTFSDGDHQPIHEHIPTERLTDVFQTIPERMSVQPLIPKFKRLGWKDRLLDNSDLDSFLP